MKTKNRLSKSLGLLSAALMFTISAPAFSQVVPLPVVTNAAGLVSGAGTSICTSALDSMGDGCPATQAALGANPQYLWGDSYGNIYIGDYANYRVRVIFHGGAPIQTLIAAANPALAGAPQAGYVYSIGGSLTSALSSPTAYCSGTSGAQATDLAGNSCPASQAFLHPYAGDTDAAGDVFFTDRAQGTQIRVIYAGGSAAATLIQLETGVTSPVVGNVYLVGGSAVAANGYRGDGGLATSATFDAAHSVSVDGNGNLYVADTTNNVVRMISSTTGIVTAFAGGLGAGCVQGTAASCTAAFAGDGGIATQASLSGPYDAIADSYGNVFISDGGNLRVRVVYAGGNLPGLTNPTVGDIYTFSGGGTSKTTGVSALTLEYSNPRDVSLDPAGNIYVTDTTTWRVWRIDRSSGIADTLIGGGTNQAAGVYCSGSTATAGLKATDSIGDGCPGTQITFKPLSRYIFDQNGIGYVTDYNNALVRAATTTPQFAATAYGTSSTGSVVETYTSSFKAPALQVAVQGSALSDFTGVATTCVPGTSYSANTVCTYTLTFAPSSPGARAGSYEFLTSGTTTVLSSESIGGVGVAPLIGMIPATASTLGATTTTAPSSVFVDEAGNLYISDTASNSLIKGAGLGSTFSTLATGLSGPTQSAVDGFGNVYVADTGNNRIAEVTTTGTTTSFATGLTAPSGVAVSKEGWIYVADSGANRVLQYVDGVERVLPLTGLNEPGALALDASGNLYIADAGNQRIVEYSSLQVQSTISTGLTARPVGLAADAAGDLYFADSISGSLWQLPAGSSMAQSVTTGLNNPGGLAIDALGDLFFTQGNVAGISELTQSLGSLTLGTSSTPQTLSLQNIGNASLSFSQTPAYIASGSTSAFTTTSDGCTGATLVAGSICTLGESFVSTAGGSDSETLAFPSNAVNSASAVASIAGGIPLAATQLGVAVTTPANGSIIFGQQVTFTATIMSATITASPTGTLSISVDGVPYTTVTVSGLTATFNDVFGVGSHTLTVAYSGDSVYATSQTSYTITVAKASDTVQITATPGSVAYGGTGTLTAVVSSTTSGTPTGTVTFYSGTTSLGTVALSGGQAMLTATFRTAGSNSVTAIYNGDGNFNTAVSNAVTVTTLDADFTMTSASGSQTILPRGFATYSFTLTPVSPATAFTSSVNFSVSGLPSGGSYTFNPTTIAAGAGSTSVSVVVYAPAAQLSALHPDTHDRGTGGSWKPLAFALLLLPFGWPLRRRRSMLRCAVCVLSATALLMSVAGCGNPAGYFTQTPKSYTLSITATSGSSTHSTGVVLTVE